MHGSVCIEQDDAKSFLKETDIAQASVKKAEEKEKDYDIRRIGKESKGFI